MRHTMLILILALFSYGHLWAEDGQRPSGVTLGPPLDYDPFAADDNQRSLTERIAVERERRRAEKQRLCGEFRSKRLIEIAMEEAWQQAMRATNGNDAAASAAYDSAQEALHAAERAASLVIYRQNDFWAEMLNTLATDSNRLYGTRVTQSQISVENRSLWFALRQTLDSAQKNLDETLHQTILLACAEPKTNPLAHLRSK